MTYIIAEIGVNHNGDMKLAKKLVDAAKAAGADAAKFQIFIAEDIVSPTAPKAEYQVKNGSVGKTQYEMLKSLELTFENAKKMKAYCEKVGIDFMSSVFGIRELDFYVDELGCKTVKFGSGELTNAPLMLASARKKVKMLISTGMSDLKDIEQALGVIAFGFTAPKTAKPNARAFQQAYKSKKGQAALKKNVLIFQCTTQYPCPDSAINLRAMQTIAAEFGLSVGFSDHSEGLATAPAAVALGAEMIEKHFTFDRNAEGPDHKASLDIPQFKQYVAGIREVERTLGDGKKTVTPAARKIADVACKHVVAARNINKGENLTLENITTRRTNGKGTPAAKYYDLLGKKSANNYKAGEPLAK